MRPEVEARRAELLDVLRAEYANGKGCLTTPALEARAMSYAGMTPREADSAVRNDISGLRRRGWQIEAVYGRGFVLASDVCLDATRLPRRAQHACIPRANLKALPPCVVAVCCATLDLLDTIDQERAVRAIVRHYDKSVY